MTNRLLISVAAAALIAGTGLANAQGTSKEQPSSGATTQHSAPSGGASPGATDRDSGSMKGTEHSTKGESSGMKGAESEKGQPGASGKSAQDTAPGQKSKSTEQETKGGKDMKGAESEKGQPGASGKSAQDTAPGQKSKSTEQETKGSKDMKAEDRGKSGSTAAESREKSGGSEAQKGATDTSRSQTTTGAATAGPPAEKRTQIVSAIKSEKIEETTDVNVNVSVGTTLPSTVRLHPLPPRIVEIYPEWRGYEVVLVKGRYVIVKPETHEIVYIIEG